MKKVFAFVSFFLIITKVFSLSGPTLDDEIDKQKKLTYDGTAEL